MIRSNCFMFGNSDAPDSVVSALFAAVVNHVENGVISFPVGHYGSFDRMAARAVILAKDFYPGITLTLLCPYHPSVCPIELPCGFDDSLYPFIQPPPPQAAIVRANRYAVDRSDCIIAYAHRTPATHMSCWNMHGDAHRKLR